MSANEASDELTPAEYRAIIRSQQSHIEKLRGMLWIAADIGPDDEPPLTEAAFQDALALPPDMQIVNMIAELEAEAGQRSGGPQCSA